MSGTHMWNGTTPSLKAMPTITNTSAKLTRMPPSPSAPTLPASAASSSVPPMP